MNISQNTEFKKLFFRKEGIELLGRSYTNLWVLVSIFFFTFLAIGFGIGSLDYLEKKMNDPFINWLNIEIPYSKSETIGNVEVALNKPELSEKFSYMNVTGYFRYSLYFWNSERNGTIQSIGRTLDINNPLVEKIFQEKNFIKGRKLNDPNDIGIIITDEFVEKFAISEDQRFLQMSVPVSMEESIYVPIPIIAIVDALPGLSEFATTAYFRQQRFLSMTISPFRKDFTNGLILNFVGDSTQIDSYYQNLEETTRKLFPNHDPMVTITPNKTTYELSFDVSISFYPEVDNQTLDSFFEKIKKTSFFKQQMIERNFKYKLTDAPNNYNGFDYLAVNFNDLKNVRKFRDYLAEKYEIDIDMAQIEAKENYSFVSRLTVIISFILILFSTFAITIFVSNVLTKHLEKVSVNIGTFMAFGISNVELKSIYKRIIAAYIGGSMFVSFVAALIYGSLGGVRLFLSIIGVFTEAKEKYFQLIDIWVVLAIFVILFFSYVMIRKSAMKILSNTPGDLIYRRW